MSNKIQYRQVGDYNVPNLVLPPEEANITLGKWGMDRLTAVFSVLPVCLTGGTSNPAALSFNFLSAYNRRTNRGKVQIRYRKRLR